MQILFVSRPSLFRQTGGDTLHLEQTARELKNLGHTVHIASDTWVDPQAYDIIHFFNLGQPAWFLPYLKKARGKPVVLSSIYVDYSSTENQLQGWRKRLFQLAGIFGMEYLKTLGRYFKKQDPWPGWNYFFNGHRWAIHQVLSKTNLLITASRAEAQLIFKHFLYWQRKEVVHLGCDHILAMNSAKHKAKKGVFCAARFEPLKNQLTLIKACQEADLPLKLAGPISRNHENYAHACRLAADTKTTILGALQGQAVAEHMQASKVHALVSHYDTTGLSTLEALAQGCQVVVSDHPIQRELFGEHAFFADPQNEQSISKALLAADKEDEDHRDWVQEHFSWQKAALKIEKYYQEIAAKS